MNCNAVARIAWRCDHRSYFIQINFKRGSVFSMLVAKGKSFSNFFRIETTRTNDVVKRHFIRLNDSCSSSRFDSHVGQRRAFIHWPVLQVLAGKLQHLANALARFHVLRSEYVKHHRSEEHTSE